MRTLILIIFVTVLTIDFMNEVIAKRPTVFDMLLRGSMLIAFIHIIDWF